MTRWFYVNRKGLEKAAGFANVNFGFLMGKEQLFCVG